MSELSTTHRRRHPRLLHKEEDSMSETPIYDQMMREAERNADDAHTLARNFAVMSA